MEAEGLLINESESKLAFNRNTSIKNMKRFVVKFGCCRVLKALITSSFCLY